VDFLGILLIGLIAGWLASRLMKMRDMGLLGYLLVGVLGAFIGGYILIFLEISVGGFFGTLLSALIGSFVLLFILKQVRGA
jgi:uncharacterized membrane protein YeaQ/YmgE (transglycosylase-associated protein family)